MLFSTTLQRDFPVDKWLLYHLHDAYRTETEYVFAIPVSEEISEGIVVCDVSQKKQETLPPSSITKMAANHSRDLREAHVKFARAQTKCPYAEMVALFIFRNASLEKGHHVHIFGIILNIFSSFFEFHENWRASFKLKISQNI